MEPSETFVASRPAEMKPVVLAFHKLLSGFSYSATNFAPRRFERLVRALYTAGYSIADRGSGGEPAKSIVFTFDDGYQHLIDALPPLMERYGFRPLIFMPTALIGKPNRWDYSYWLRSAPHLERREIKKLSQLGVVFGSHGHLHTDLSRYPDRRILLELKQSREILADLTGQRITAISYPFGRYSQKISEAAELAGFEIGYTMEWPSLDEHPLARGRIPIYAYDSLLSIRQKLSDGLPNRIERLKARITNRLSGGTILLNRLRRFN